MDMFTDHSENSASHEIALTSAQLAEVIGVSPRMPTLWAERGYIAPSLQEAEGRGSKRLWSRQDAVQALLVKLLLPHLSAGILRRLARVLEGRRNALDPGDVWRIPLGRDEGVLVRICRAGTLEPYDGARVQRLERVELLESGGDVKGLNEEEGPIVLSIALAGLYAIVDEQLMKMG